MLPARPRGAVATRRPGLPGTAGTRQAARPAAHTGGYGDGGIRHRRCAAGGTGPRPRPPGCPPAGAGAAAGLRREELALLAGISVDYVTRLEQGRAANPSAQVVEALARALRLSRNRAGPPVPAGRPGPAGPGHGARGTSPRASSGCWTGWPGRPSRSTTRPGRCSRSNPPYAALMGDPSEWRGNQRNGVWRNLVGPGQPGPADAGVLAARSRPRSVADLRAAPAATRPTSGCGSWSRSCARTVTGSPSCGIPARSAATRPRARPSTTRRSAP